MYLELLDELDEMDIIIEQQVEQVEYL